MLHLYDINTWELRYCLVGSASLSINESKNNIVLRVNKEYTIFSCIRKLKRGLETFSALSVHSAASDIAFHSTFTDLVIADPISGVPKVTVS